MKALATNFHHSSDYSTHSSRSTLNRSSSQRFKLSSFQTSSSSSSSSTSPGNSSHNGFSSKSASTLLRRIKKLERALDKFNSIKKYTTTKTNILRLVLLPYLRHNCSCFCIPRTSLASNSSSFLVVSSSCTILMEWWKTLLLAATQHFHQLVSMDKDCYLECISRIVSRPEWELCRFLSQNSSPSSKVYSSSTELIKSYSGLLLQTFGLAMDRLSVKHISLAISAFVGKIFAYSFFWLPRICHGLTFLLNTKVKNYSLMYNMCVLGLKPGEFAFKFSKTVDSTREAYANALKDVAGLVPKYMESLMVDGPRQTRFKIESAYLNSVYPPKGKIEGIEETKGTWCARWSSLTNIDVFCSFLRHYLHICSQIFHEKPSWATDELHVYALPGWLYILTHVLEIFSYHMRQRASCNGRNTSRTAGSMDLHSVTRNSGPKSVPHSSSFSSSSSFPITFAPGMSSGAYLRSPSPPQKILKVMRDIMVNPKSVAETIISSSYIKANENVLKILVCQTKVLETAMVDRMLQMFVKFARTAKCAAPSSLLLSSATLSSTSALSARELAVCESSKETIDWPFWIAICFKLLTSRSISCELRGLSIIYQCWDLIPDYQVGSYGNDAYQPVKSELASKLVSEKTWLSFFGHYLPLVRSFYIRLLVWKVLGQESLGLTAQNHRSFGDSIARERLTKTVSTLLKRTYQSTKHLSFNPDDPIINKRIIIRELDPSFCSATKTEPIRALSYDILDDAAYTCAGLAVNSGLNRSEDDCLVTDSSENDDTKTTASSKMAIEQKPGSAVTPQNRLAPGGNPSPRRETKRHSHSWVSRLFGHGTLYRMGSMIRSDRTKRKVEKSGLENTGKEDAKTSSQTGDILSKQTPHQSAKQSQKPSGPLRKSLLEKLQEEEDTNIGSESYESLLQTPPRIFGSSTSSPSLSSKSSSLSLLSSMASASSPQSSTSSLDFLDQFTSSTKYIQSIQKLQRKKKQHSMKFVPPELNAVSIELPPPQYRFELINNDLKMSASYQGLHDLNANGKAQTGQSFFSSNKAVVQNSKPGLPDFVTFISSRNESSIDDQIDSGTDLDIDVMASENLPAIETDLRLSKSSFKKSSESSFSDSSTASSSLSMLSRPLF